MWTRQSTSPSGTGRLPPLRPVPEPRVTTGVRVSPASLKNRGNLLGAARKGDAPRHLAEGGGAIEAVRDEILGGGENGFGFRRPRNRAGRATSNGIAGRACARTRPGGAGQRGSGIAGGRPTRLCFGTRLLDSLHEERSLGRFAGVIPSPSGCAIFLGNDTKTFVIQVENNMGMVISMFMRDAPKERPLTHDLMASVFEGFGISVNAWSWRRTQGLHLLRPADPRAGERTWPEADRD